MPAISTNETPKPKVLVTGANGYIAAWIIRGLLGRGYQVRGTVRSEEKGERLRDILGGFGHEENFEFMLVKDNSDISAYNEAVKTVDAIIHAASPVNASPATPNELVLPALQGTTNLLQSALLYGSSSLKRIVMLSSCSAIIEPDQDKEFIEEDWCESAIAWIKEHGGDASLEGHDGMIGYQASKTLSERAAWDFYHKHKSTIPWDLTVLNPPFVFGPPTHPLGSSSDSLNASLRVWWGVLSPYLLPAPAPPPVLPEDALITLGAAWIGVRDLAEAHVRALESDKASEERIIVSAGSYVWQEWVDAIQRVTQSASDGSRQDVGRTNTKDVKYTQRYNTEKERRILGIKFRSMEESVKDMLEDFRRRGYC